MPLCQLVIFEVNKPPLENVYKDSLDPFVEVIAQHHDRVLHTHSEPTFYCLCEIRWDVETTRGEPYIRPELYRTIESFKTFDEAKDELERIKKLEDPNANEPLSQMPNGSQSKTMKDSLRFLQILCYLNS